MKVYRGTDSLPVFGPTVVTVGSFDGVHPGHKALLRAAIDEANRRGGESIAVTFWPHPRKVLKTAVRTWLLSPIDEKLQLLEKEGIDITVVIPFDISFSNTGSREFLQDFIKGRLNASAMVVGYDHRFGHNKDGDYDLLSQTGCGLGLDVIRIEEQKGDGFKISSTEIRRAVSQGDMSTAARILGHNYFVIGSTCSKDVNGCRLERMCFLPSDIDKLMPPDGEYLVKIRVRDGGSFEGNLIVENGSFSLASCGCPPTAGQAEVEFL